MLKSAASVFHVEMKLPLSGLIVRYCGVLVSSPAAP